jgi:drug/metabolite transporter (DMT)-like permease
MPILQSLPSGNLLGIFYMNIAMLAGILTSLIVKDFSAIAAVLVVLSLRFLTSIPLLLITAWVVRKAAWFKINRWDRLVMRIVVGHCGIIFWFLSIKYATLGQATALFQSSAIFVTLLSPFILNEKVGLYRGGAVVAGLVGIYLITNPFSANLNIGALFGIGSALAGAFLVILLRLLGRTDEPVSVALWHNIVGALIYPLLVLVIGLGPDLISMTSLYPVTLIIFGIAACFVQIGFTTAYRHGEAVVLVPVRYLSVPIASVLGWMIWSEAPNLVEISGMIIVISSCLLISVREYILGRRRPVGSDKDIPDNG